MFLESVAVSMSFHGQENIYMDWRVISLDVRVVMFSVIVLNVEWCFV